MKNDAEESKSPSLTSSGSIVFADLAESSRLYGRLGDREAHRVVQAGLGLAREVIESWGGRVIEIVGDELFCAFDDAAVSLRAAMELQGRLLERDLEEGPAATLRMRIGVHAGSVIVQGDRVIGNTVYVAHRVSERAKAGQLLTTRETLELAGPEDFPTRPIDRVVLKGQSQEHDIFEVLVGPDTTTESPRGTAPPRRIATKLELRLGSEAWQFEPTSSGITLGRDGACDIVVAAGPVSRRHATIEHGPDAWTIVDVSTNGTLLRPDEDPDRVVHRTRAPLSGSGLLFLGADEGVVDSCIRFKVHAVGLET